MTAPCTTDRMPNLTGKTITVTGANSGIGLEAARAFAAKGAHAVFAVRDEKKGRDAAATVSGATEVRPLDLADLESVREFAESWSVGIQLLINNAGVLVPPPGHTKVGFELQFGINHLGHFALTNLLLPHITGRVVTVASSAHRSGTINFDDLNWHTRRYGGGSGAYAQSKLAVGLFAQDAATGATPTLFAATGPVPGGGYAGPGDRREMAGPPVLVGRSEAAGDLATAAQLWAASKELTGVRYPAAQLAGIS